MPIRFAVTVARETNPFPYFDAHKHGVAATPSSVPLPGVVVSLPSDARSWSDLLLKFTLNKFGPQRKACIAARRGLGVAISQIDAACR
jgi:hypothetical protein